MLKITDEMREAARQLSLGKHDASEIAKLKAIADGKRKLVDHSWWKQFFADIDRAKLDKIARMADPARNDKEHERAVAARKLAAFKARRAPGLPPEHHVPIAKSAAEYLAKRKIKRPVQMPPSPAQARKRSDSVATPLVSDSVAPSPLVSDSVAHDRNIRRTTQRAAKRTGLKCQTCGKPLVAAQRATARYCNATCRSQAWRKIAKKDGTSVNVPPSP